MNLTDKQKQWIAWIAMALVITLISTFLGVKYPIPEPPPFLPDEITALGTTHFTNIQAEDVTATDDLAVTDDATIGGDMTVSGTTSWGCSDTTISDNLSVSGTITGNAVVITTTLDASGATTLNSTLDVDGNISSGTGAITMTDSLNVTGTVDFDSTLNVDGATTVDSLDVDNGSITLQNDETIANSTDGLISFGGGLIFNTTTITVTDGQTITPTTYSGYRLNAAGAVTITLAACSSDFQPLLLYGEDAQTVTIADTNVRTNDGGVQALGQYDLISWMCINSEWVELSDSNNS